MKGKTVFAELADDGTVLVTVDMSSRAVVWSMRADDARALRNELVGLFADEDVVRRLDHIASDTQCDCHICVTAADASALIVALRSEVEGLRSAVRDGCGDSGHHWEVEQRYEADRPVRWRAIVNQLKGVRRV